MRLRKRPCPKSTLTGHSCNKCPLEYCAEYAYSFRLTCLSPWTAMPGARHVSSRPAWGLLASVSNPAKLSQTRAPDAHFGGERERRSSAPRERQLAARQRRNPVKPSRARAPNAHLGGERERRGSAPRERQLAARQRQEGAGRRRRHDHHIVHVAQRIAPAVQPKILPHEIAVNEKGVCTRNRMLHWMACTGG